MGNENTKQERARSRSPISQIPQQSQITKIPTNTLKISKAALSTLKQRQIIITPRPQSQNNPELSFHKLKQNLTKKKRAKVDLQEIQDTMDFVSDIQTNIQFNMTQNNIYRFLEFTIDAITIENQKNKRQQNPNNWERHSQSYTHHKSFEEQLEHMQRVQFRADKKINFPSIFTDPRFKGDRQKAIKELKEQENLFNQELQKTASELQRKTNDTNSVNTSSNTQMNQLSFQGKQESKTTNERYSNATANFGLGDQISFENKINFSTQFQQQISKERKKSDSFKELELTLDEDDLLPDIEGTQKLLNERNQILEKEKAQKEQEEMIKKTQSDTQFLKKLNKFDLQIEKIEQEYQELSNPNTNRTQDKSINLSKQHLSPNSSQFSQQKTKNLQITAKQLKNVLKIQPKTTKTTKKIEFPQQSKSPKNQDLYLSSYFNQSNYTQNSKKIHETKGNSFHSTLHGSKAPQECLTERSLSKNQINTSISGKYSSLISPRGNLKAKTNEIQSPSNKNYFQSPKNNSSTQSNKNLKKQDSKKNFKIFGNQKQQRSSNNDSSFSSQHNSTLQQSIQPQEGQKIESPEQKFKNQGYNIQNMSLFMIKFTVKVVQPVKITYFDVQLLKLITSSVIITKN